MIWNFVLVGVVCIVAFIQYLFFAYAADLIERLERAHQEEYARTQHLTELEKTLSDAQEQFVNKCLLAGKSDNEVEC